MILSIVLTYFSIVRLIQTAALVRGLPYDTDSPLLTRSTYSSNHGPCATVPVYKCPVFRQSSPKLDLINNINVLESSPCASPFPHLLHKSLRAISSNTRDFYSFKVLATSSFLVQVVLSRPVEALTELIYWTHKVFKLLLKLDLYLRPAKCSFNQTSVEYLGLIISEGELHMDPVKLKAVQDWPSPKKVKDIQQFLGFCNFYCHFVQDYSTLARPLFDLTKKDTPWAWTHSQETAFTALQHALTSAPVLILPDYDKPFTLITDASDYATGSILEQDDALGRSHPVAFYSKSLQPAKQNYEIHDKELLAIIHALKHFCHYLQGSAHQTKIFSDHANLKYFTTKQTLTRRQVWWSLFLGTFDYVIIPKPGKINKADALSRRPDYKEGIASENAETILLTLEKFLLKPEQFHIWALHNMAIPMGINEELKEAIQEAIKTDILMGQKLKDILTSGPRQVNKGLQEWNYEDGLILYKGLIYIPKTKNEELKQRVTQQFHDNLMGHPGQWKTIELISCEYWWPGITEFVKAYI